MTPSFVVRRARGRRWNPALPMREQRLWSEHAAFMNALAAEGFVLLGGPLGEGRTILLVVAAPDEGTVRSRLAEDPWTVAGLLEVESIQPWTILLDSRDR